MIKIIDNFFQTGIANQLHASAVKRNNLNKNFKGYEAIDYLENIDIDQFKNKFPELNGTELKRSWGFIYENNVEGVPPHADPADLNLNVWLTPNECVDDKEKNGMKIWLIKPPKEWSFISYNSNTEKIKDYIGTEKPLDIPYKFNRAILFDSKYFHATSGVSMKKGKLNRRVSFTFLFDIA